MANQVKANILNENKMQYTIREADLFINQRPDPRDTSFSIIVEITHKPTGIMVSSSKSSYFGVMDQNKHLKEELLLILEGHWPKPNLTEFEPVFSEFNKLTELVRKKMNFEQRPETKEKLKAIQQGLISLRNDLHRNFDF